MALRNRVGIAADELIAAQDALDIAIVENVFGSGQAQRRSGNHHRGVSRNRLLSVGDLPAVALQTFRKQTTEFVIRIAMAIRRLGRQDHWGHGSWWSSSWLGFCHWRSDG